MRKLLIASLIALSLIGGVSAQSTVFELSDQTVEESTVFSTEPFTADGLDTFNASTSIDTNESLEATVKAYNDTEQTGNQSFTLTDGSNSNSVNSFGSNTSTYVVDFNASGGTVSILDVEITGTETNSKTSAVAPSPGQILSGIRFDGVPIVSHLEDFLAYMVNGVYQAFAGLIP